jgi:hypothetical protein
MPQLAPEYIRMAIKRKLRDRLDMLADIRGITRAELLDTLLERFIQEEIDKILKEHNLR